MLSYSPYDNLTTNPNKPFVFVSAGLWDPRVAYWEPAKWVPSPCDPNDFSNSNKVGGQDAL